MYGRVAPAHVERVVPTNGGRVVLDLDNRHCVNL